MPGSLQSKGDGEYPYSAPFTGLDASLPSILLPPSAQDTQTSTSFAIVRGSVCAPWPISMDLLGLTMSPGEYLLFATPSGYVVTSQFIYQFQANASTIQMGQVATMPTNAWPVQGSNKEIPWIETNGCIYFGCQLGIYRYAAVNGITPWAVGFTPNYLTIFNQRMVVVGTQLSTNNVTPTAPTGSGTTGSVPAGTYYAVVTALFSGTEGPPSPESLPVTLGSTGGILWTWAAVPGATGYNIYVGTQPGLENTVFFAGSSTTFNMGAFTSGTVTPPVPPPFSPWTIAWSAVSTFSATSVGSFNSAPNTNAGVVGGFDVLTNYSQGIPIGIINLGHSIYIIMTQGIVEMDPAQSGTAPFTFYNYWQERIPVGGVQGSLDQFGPIACFITPDNVNIWVPGSQTQIGAPIMPYLRQLLRNVSLTVDPNASYPLLQNPPFNASFYTFYNELHYALSFNVFGFPPLSMSPPYPQQISEPEWFGMILDYNFQSKAWTQQQTPPITTKLFQVNGPPIDNPTIPGLPTQSILIAGTQPSPGAQAGFVVFAPDAFNPNEWGTGSIFSLDAVPQPCTVGFPQTPISPSHRVTYRRVRIEYSMDELTVGGATTPVDVTIAMQGTITQNTGSVNGQANFTTQIVSSVVTVTLNPPGSYNPAPPTIPITPFLICNAYADMVQSMENPQITLSWTDPAPGKRLMIHRCTALVNDSKGVTQ